MRPILLLSFSLVFVAATAQTAESLYSEGIQLKGQKKSAEAAEKFRQALAIKPDHTEARYELGWCQNDLKNYPEALKLLRTVRESWASIPKVHFELGYAFEKTGAYDSAINSYNKALLYKPDYYSAYRQLGYVNYLKEDYKLALEQFENYASKYTAEIKDYLFWYRKGFSENALKKYDLAKTSLQNSLKYKNDYINTYLELGFAAKNLKQNEEAIDWYKQASSLDPKSHVPYNGIGEVYRDNFRDMEKAKEWYGKTLSINSNERKANFGMGYCLNSQQRYSEAIAYLQKAIENEKTYTAAYVELGYSQYKTRDFTSAIMNFNKAIELNPSNENSRYYATLLYIEQKNKSMAQKLVDELKKLNSKYAADLQNRVSAM